MVLGIGKKRPPPDPYLIKPIKTERFHLVNCNRSEAIKVTLPWRVDPEVLHNLMMGKPSYSKYAWARNVGKPDGATLFYHGIVDRHAGGTIGTHRLNLDRSGNASMAIVVHARHFWGKDVFDEVRTAILDHFSRSEKVNRFYGRVLSRNFSSIYNYTKLGFRLIGHDRQAWLSPITDEYCDTMHYEMLAKDWRDKRGLEAPT
ncbi:MAG: GNAT family protein [Pseudomonadota bacterium]